MRAILCRQVQHEDIIVEEKKTNRWGKLIELNESMTDQELWDAMLENSLRSLTQEQGDALARLYIGEWEKWMDDFKDELDKHKPTEEIDD